MEEKEHIKETTIAPRTGDELPPELESYLRDHLRVSGPFSVRQFPGGYSNLTYSLSFGDETLVLRRPPRGTKAQTAHDMGREYFVLTRLREHFSVCPTPLHFCEDPAIIGAPFYIMSYIEGIVLRAQLPKGFQADPEVQKAQMHELIALEAKLHGLDYSALGLAEFGQPQGYRERQIKGWSKRYRAAKTDDAPDFEAIMDWLAQHLPEGDESKSSLIHNDFKLDNVVFDAKDPTRIIGVLDWEMATLGDPLMDLGNSLAYWIEPADPDFMKAMQTLPSHLPGFPGRREQLELYQRFSGCSLNSWDFYYTSGLFRLAVIAQQIYARFRQGHSSDARFGQLIHGVRGLERACQMVIEGRLL